MLRHNFLLSFPQLCFSFCRSLSRPRTGKKSSTPTSPFSPSSPGSPLYPQCRGLVPKWQFVPLLSPPTSLVHLATLGLNCEKMRFILSKLFFHEDGRIFDSAHDGENWKTKCCFVGFNCIHTTINWCHVLFFSEIWNLSSWEWVKTAPV